MTAVLIVLELLSGDDSLISNFIRYFSGEICVGIKYSHRTYTYHVLRKDSYEKGSGFRMTSDPQNYKINIITVSNASEMVNIQFVIESGRNAAEN